MLIDYKAARELLDRVYGVTDAAFLLRTPPEIIPAIQNATAALVNSSTQAYREVLLGCVLARILDQRVNIRTPYTKQGPNAFSGRSLDEKVVNPFLQEKRIPASRRGPYLAVFRRGVTFDSVTGDGLKDQAGYDALLQVISYLESTHDVGTLDQYLSYLLYRFLELREASTIPLSKLRRMSLVQYDTLLSGLLASPSGGRFPVLLVVATFEAIKLYFHLDWSIEWQGINVADTASGAGGDITIKSSGAVLMAAEVTERPVDKSRVVATFNTKISPNEIEDYLFFIKDSGVTTEVSKQAHQYFAQGHEVNFLVINNWILTILATIGKTGRAEFNKILLNLLDASNMPKSMKVAWNDQVAKLVS